MLQAVWEDSNMHCKGCVAHRENINSLASAGKMQMLGNVTKFVWNTAAAADPRPVYKKITSAGVAAAKYESFDTSGIASTITDSVLSSFDTSGITNSLFSSLNLSGTGTGTGPGSSWVSSSDASGTSVDTVIANIGSGVGAVTIVFYIALVIGAFLCACLAANQMLYMPAIMRILVFIMVLGSSLINPFFMAGIFLYFMFVLFLDLFRHYKGIYNMDQFIFPATLLPLRLRRPEDSFLIRILLAPFTYIEPNPADLGRQDYLAGIDQYLANLQRGAKITDELLASANLKGLKESIAKGFRDPVEELTRLFVAKQEAASQMQPTEKA